MPAEQKIQYNLPNASNTVLTTMLKQESFGNLAVAGKGVNNFN